jgi:REP element-mobilizing transposase RayT
MPKVIAYHLILAAYGFWLPNDPRGSWSDFVRSFELYRTAGPATKVNTKASRAQHPHDHAVRLAAKAELKHEPVLFTGKQAREVALGFEDYIVKNERQVLACAIMPDHAHLVIARCDKPIETIAEQLKARATMFLKRADLHPFGPPDASHAEAGRLPTPWARKSWSVFLRDAEAILRAIQYVQQNPIKAGYKPQPYNWVKPYPA